MKSSMPTLDNKHYLHLYLQHQTCLHYLSSAHLYMYCLMSILHIVYFVYYIRKCKFVRAHRRYDGKLQCLNLSQEDIDLTDL